MCFVVFEMSPGNAAWLVECPFSCGMGFEEAVESHLCPATRPLLTPAAPALVGFWDEDRLYRLEALLEGMLAGM